MVAMVGLAWRCLPIATSVLANPRTLLPSHKAPPCSLFVLPQQRSFTTRQTGSQLRRRRTITNILRTGSSNDPSPEEPDNTTPTPSSSSSSAGVGSTRLGRLISARRKDLLRRWNTARRNFPTKIFLLLLGFFAANALATILGQTGDWDVIAAGILVAAIEGIGHLIYNRRLPGREILGEERSWTKSAVELLNYWKIGFVFALFVDAFKLGS